SQTIPKSRPAAGGCTSPASAFKRCGSSSSIKPFLPAAGGKQNSVAQAIVAWPAYARQTTDSDRLPHLLSKCLFRFAGFFGLNAPAEQALEKTFTHEPVDRAIVDHRPEIELPHLCRRLLVHGVIDHVLHRSFGQIGHPFEGVGFCVAIINALQL